MVVYLSYNVAGTTNLAGLKQLLLVYKPDYVFLQEIIGTKEHLEAHLGGDYNCQVNVDMDNMNQPGTAVAWKSSLEVVVVPICIESSLVSQIKISDKSKVTQNLIPSNFDFMHCVSKIAHFRH